MEGERNFLRVRWRAECWIPRPPSIQVLPGTLWPGVSLPPDPAQPHLRATLRDLGPWYLVLTASAFSRKRSDRSYSILRAAPARCCSGGSREGPGQLHSPGMEASPAAPPSTPSSSAISGWSSPNHEQCEVAGAVQQAQGGGQLTTGKAIQRQVHLQGQTGSGEVGRPPPGPAGPPRPQPRRPARPRPRRLLAYSWMVLGADAHHSLSLISTAFCWLLAAPGRGEGLSSPGGTAPTPRLSVCRRP